MHLNLTAESTEITKNDSKQYRLQFIEQFINAFIDAIEHHHIHIRVHVCVCVQIHRKFYTE